MMQRMNVFCFYYTDIPKKEDDVYLSDLLAAVQSNAGNSLVVGGVSVIVQTVR